MITAADDPAYPDDTLAGGLGLDYLRYMAYWRNPPASFTLRDLQFTVDAYRRLQPLGGIYNATDPDLRAFRGPRRQADPLPRLGRPGDLPVVDAGLLRGRRPRDGRLRRHAALLAPVHGPRALPLPVRAVPHGRSGRRRSTSWTSSSTGSRTARRPARVTLPGDRPDDRDADRARSPSSRSTRSRRRRATTASTATTATSAARANTARVASCGATRTR